MRFLRSVHPYAILALVAVLLMLPGLIFQMATTDSAVFNYVWISQFGSAMQHGNFYPRWLPDSFEGMGSPAFYFYPPLAYWVGGTFSALGASVPLAISLTGMVLLFASGITMHLWLADRGTRPLLGAILYMAFPYHLLDFYLRGALAEFAAFIWLPLIALAIERLPQRRGIVLLAFSYAAMIISHLPVAMLTGVFLIAPLMLHRIWRDRTVILPAITGLTAGIALAGFYLLPALLLQDHISSALLWSRGRYLPSMWRVWEMYFGFAPCIGIAMGALALSVRSKWTVIGLVCSLAALNLIPLLWDIPPLTKAQFPWRLLCIAEFVAITAILSAKPRPIMLGIGAAMMVPTYVLAGGTAGVYMLLPQNYPLMQRTMPDAVEYLPAGFDISRMTEKMRNPDLARYRTLPTVTEMDVRQAGPVSFRRFAFPIWRVTRDGQEVASTGPVITVQAHPGHYRLQRVLIWQEVVGALLSLAAALMLAFLHYGRRQKSSGKGVSDVTASEWKEQVA